MSEERQEKGRTYLPRSWGGSRPKKPQAQDDQEGTTRGQPADTNIPEYDTCASACASAANPEVASPTAADPIVEISVCPCQHAEEPAPIDPEVAESGLLAETSEPDVVRIRTRIAGVRFGYACKIYHFNAGDMELARGDWVMVKTEKGIGLGQVAMTPFERELEAVQLEGLRHILRKAGRADFDQRARCSQRETEAYQYCLDRIEDLGLQMKLIAVECFFDASKYVFYFTSEGRVDFRELVKQLVARFPVRIEMRQIGVRHAAKMTGGIACCGQELCCARYLTDFRPVSVKMAKTQNLSLNPAKISGGCGRLMCCLAYEHDTYEDFKKGLPKVGKQVRTAQGEGVIVKFNPLTQTVSVMLRDETMVDLSRDDIRYDADISSRKKDDADEECLEEAAGDVADSLDDGALPEPL